MSNIAVKVENLGKKYIIGHKKAGDLRASIGDKFRHLFSKNGSSKEEFWALKDVSFEIKKGEAVGIIGRNGAGKSTLLKLLSRITDPSTGRFEINGRVSSLLEVGTGFHPELSGRENIFLNGTILGMRRSEIKAKFDEIVDFSGVEKFIDTPVKHYSSGMKVRLAFSVAAHLEPEILIVDEVLAVGDAEFQKKCLGKMDEVSKGEGRTILFVSHNMSAIETLCSKGLSLNAGRISFLGGVNECIAEYLNDPTNDKPGSIWNKGVNENNKAMEILSASLKLAGKQPDLQLTVSLFCKSNFAHKKAFVAYDLMYEDGTPVFQTIPSDKPFIDVQYEGRFISSEINLPPLIPGKYKVSVWIGPHYAETYDWRKEILMFAVDNSPMPHRTHPHSRKHGFIVPLSTIVE